MPLMEWIDSYSVKVDSIDEQHKKLFALLNNLNEQMVQGAGKKALKQTLADVYAYTQYHFEYEESLMEKAEFQGIGEHRNDHTELTSNTLALYTKLGKGDYKLAIETMQFLRNWWNNHILMSDMQFSQLMVDKGIQ